MSDDTRKPSHIAYHVREGQDGKSYFNRVGSAFEHKDREGLNIFLDAVPVDGRVTLRTPSERVQEVRDCGDRKTQRRSRSRNADYERD